MNKSNVLVVESPNLKNSNRLLLIACILFIPALVSLTLLFLDQQFGILFPSGTSLTLTLLGQGLSAWSFLRKENKKALTALIGYHGFSVEGKLLVKDSKFYKIEDVGYEEIYLKEVSGI